MEREENKIVEEKVNESSTVVSECQSSPQQKIVFVDLIVDIEQKEEEEITVVDSVGGSSDKKKMEIVKKEKAHGTIQKIWDKTEGWTIEQKVNHTKLKQGINESLKPTKTQNKYCNKN